MFCARVGSKVTKNMKTRYLSKEMFLVEFLFAPCYHGLDTNSSSRESRQKIAIIGFASRMI